MTIILISSILENFHDLLCGFETIHDWHLQVHENESIGSVSTFAVFFIGFLEHFKSLLPIEGGISMYSEYLLNKNLERQQIEVVIVHQQNLRLAHATRTMRVPATNVYTSRFAKA